MLSGTYSRCPLGTMAKLLLVSVGIPKSSPNLPGFLLELPEDAKNINNAMENIYTTKLNARESTKGKFQEWVHLGNRISRQSPKEKNVW